LPGPGDDCDLSGEFPRHHLTPSDSANVRPATSIEVQHSAVLTTAPDLVIQSSELASVAKDLTLTGLQP
jgi:hypothetical protein